MYVMLYKEVEMALGINSFYSKQKLMQHENIKVRELCVLIAQFICMHLWYFANVSIPKSNFYHAWY